MNVSAPSHIHFEVTDSTMEAARREATSHEALLVTAATQTGGRGTRGRPWHSPPGNLYLTIALQRRLIAPATLHLLPLEAGIALWDAIVAFLPPHARADLRLKWPNDVLWNGRKTAGMLLEATTEHFFIGTGINIDTAPQVTDGGTPSGKLADAGISADATDALAKAFFQRLRQRLTEGDSLQTLSLWTARADWRRPLLLRDRPGRPEVFPVDVNTEGHLRVRFPDGREEWLISEYLA